MLRSDQCANLRLRPKLHSTPPPGIMTPETCRPRCCSNAGRDDTSWKQRLSSIMANRPDNQSSSAPAVATTREGLIRHDKSASGLSAMRRSIWTGLRLPGFLIVRNTNLTGRSPKLRRSCPTSGDSRPNAFAISSTSSTKSARPVPLSRFLRHANSARSPTPSITCRTASWPCGHPAPPLSGVQVRYAFLLRRTVPSVTPCLEAC